jgi:hypothetical protein
MIKEYDFPPIKIESNKNKIEEFLKVDLYIFVKITECLDGLKKAQLEKHTESAHEDADECLMKFLTDIGFPDIAYEYDQVEKWYS